MAEIRAKLPGDTEIELWWQDEARIGQKNKITRRWAKRGTRPSAPKDQRTRSVYIFGAICPARGVGAALVLPRCNTAAMNLHLQEISVAVTPGAHAIVIVDQAGWHFSKPWRYRTTSPCCPCRRNRRNSTRSKTSGSSCAITGCPTGFLNHTKIPSTTAASPGTSLSINLGRSCLSAGGNGHMGSD